jgi:hypothetical protein
LLGIGDAQVAKLASGTNVTATVTIPSPLDGVVTTRVANVGMNVDPSVPLFTVADLSTVWVVGDLNERDLAQVKIGSPVIVTASSLPGSIREGKVSYIDPQIKADTRTVQLRVEMANPGGQLRLGMYVELEVRADSAETTVVVPRAAVQIVGDRRVVYVAVPRRAGQFTERAVETGDTVGDSIQIRSGVTTGEVIVTKGSFAVRSEAERLGARSPSQDASAAYGSVQTSPARIIVSEKGFEPSYVDARAGVPVRLLFERTTDATCATEVAIPSLNIKRALPLHQPVAIEFTPAKPGRVEFACGMGMFNGAVVVQ